MSRHFNTSRPDSKAGWGNHILEQRRRHIEFVRRTLHTAAIRVALSNGERITVQTAKLVNAVRRSKWRRAIGTAFALIQLIRVQSRTEEVIASINSSERISDASRH